MKNLIFTLLFALMCAGQASAQAPQAFNFQAVARNNAGQAIVSQVIALRVSVLTGSTTGTAEYVEKFTTTTNQSGMFTIGIGTGAPLSGTFGGITWGSGNKYLNIEMDITGGTNYTQVGTQQLLSVPYALYAQNAGNSTANYTAGNGISISGNTIANTKPSKWNEGTSFPTAETGVYYNSGNFQGQVRIGTNKAMWGALNVKGYTTNNPNSQFNNWTDLVGYFDRNENAAWHQTLNPDNTLGFMESGVGNIPTLSLKKNRNVGINTWNPTGKFEIVGENVAMPFNVIPTFRIGGNGGDANHISTNVPMVFNIPASADYGFVFRKTNFDNLGDYTDLARLTPDGRFGIGKFIGYTTPVLKAELHINNGDIYLDDATKGVIMKSPNGQCWRMTVSNTGQAVFTAITCP